MEEGTPLERINSIIDAYIDSMHERQRFFRMYFTHFHPGSQDECCQMGKSDMLLERRKKVVEQIEGVFEQGI